MLGGGNSGGGGIANDNTQSPSSKDDLSQISNEMDDEIPF
jgi:single-strand DNA-binding protein